jgi:hypothetical protein
MRLGAVITNNEADRVRNVRDVSWVLLLVDEEPHRPRRRVQVNFQHHNGSGPEFRKRIQISRFSRYAARASKTADQHHRNIGDGIEAETSKLLVRDEEKMIGTERQLGNR